MPFTLAHAAAALPFRRTRLVFSAVVFGSFAPDFEYFLRLGPWGKFGHTWQGLFVFDLPVGFVMLWLFHRYAKETLWRWLPREIRERVRLGPRRLPMKDVPELMLVLVSILAGSVTHIVWDSFTHPYYWPYRHWPLLSYEIPLPVVGGVPYYEVLQHLSTLIGLAVLAVWFMRRVRATAPEPVSSAGGARERTIFWAAFAIAVLGGAIRTVAGMRATGLRLNNLGGFAGPHGAIVFCAEAGITAISIFWVETVVFGVVREWVRVVERR